jgi:hypothetical protein
MLSIFLFSCFIHNTSNLCAIPNTSTMRTKLGTDSYNVNNHCASTIKTQQHQANRCMVLERCLTTWANYYTLQQYRVLCLRAGYTVNSNIIFLSVICYLPFSRRMFITSKLHEQNDCRHESNVLCG